MAKKPQQGGFMQGAGSVFGQAAHDAMLQTLRDFASRPEQESQIAARQQSVDASKEDQAMQRSNFEYAVTQRGAQEDKNKAETDKIKGQAAYYGQQRQRLMALAGDKLKPSDIVDHIRNVQSSLDKNLFRDDADKADMQEELSLYKYKLKQLGGIKEQKPGAAGEIKTSAGGKNKYKSADDVRVAFKSGALTQDAAIAILKSDFGKK